MATGKVTIASIGKLRGWLWDDKVIGFGARRQTKGLLLPPVSAQRYADYALNWPTWQSLDA